MTLKNKMSQKVLLPRLEVAKTFKQRGVGLLGRARIEEDQGLWIWSCNSIHTFFMKFSIDCVFIDKNLQVKKVFNDVRPFRLVLPVWGASSVIEMKSGQAQRLNIQVGDQLYVGT